MRCAALPNWSSRCSNPNAEVLPQNRFYRVVTRQGETITGRLLNMDTFTVQILDSKERLVSLQRSDLRESGFVENSPMPSYKDKLSSDGTGGPGHLSGFPERSLR